MKSVSPLTDAEQLALTQIYQTGNTHRPRHRAHAVLLSAQGYSLSQLAELFATKRDTVSHWLDAWQPLARCVAAIGSMRGSHWLDAWQQTGLNGRADAPKSGRPRKVTPEVEAVLLDLLENPTPALKALVTAELRKKPHGLMGHAETAAPR